MAQLIDATGRVVFEGEIVGAGGAPDWSFTAIAPIILQDQDLGCDDAKTLYRLTADPVLAGKFVFEARGQYVVGDDGSATPGENITMRLGPIISALLGVPSAIDDPTPLGAAIAQDKPATYYGEDFLVPGGTNLGATVTLAQGDLIQVLATSRVTPI